MTDSNFHSLDGTLEAVWLRLMRGVTDRSAPARHPAFATVGAEGGAEVRTVVTRRADRDTGVLEIHTDAHTGKVKAIARDPKASLLVWDAGADFQIRLRVTVTLRSGTDAAADWERVPDTSRGNYGGTSPGTQIASPDAAEFVADRNRFAVLECCIDEIETLHLGKDRHYRALFRRDDGFTGAWLAP